MSEEILSILSLLASWDEHHARYLKSQLIDDNEIHLNLPVDAAVGRSQRELPQPERN